MFFTSERLFFRRLQESDRVDFFDMMGNPKVMDPVPAAVMSQETSDENFDKHATSDFDKTDLKVLAIVNKETEEFLGIAAFLVNDEGDPEIGYRLREKHWGIGFGSETCKAFIDYGFSDMGYEKITADVDTENSRSVKILDKLFTREREFFNEKDGCLDRRYFVLKP